MAFIRGKRRQTKQGEKTFYYLVENERGIDDKVCQTVIEYLGEYTSKADAIEANQAKLDQYHAQHPRKKSGPKPRESIDPLLEDSRRQQEMEREIADGQIEALSAWALQLTTSSESVINPLASLVVVPTIARLKAFVDHEALRH
jgi:hypothetical protein